jgi:hypothetical protein
MRVNTVSISTLKLENLKDLDDGLLAASLDANIREVIRDLSDRPIDDRPRKVTLTLTFIPDHCGGDLDRVKLEHKVTSAIPSREGRECILTPKKLGNERVLLFATVGTDARQPHLFDDDPSE